MMYSSPAEFLRSIPALHTHIDITRPCDRVMPCTGADHVGYLASNKGDCYKAKNLILQRNSFTVACQRTPPAVHVLAIAGQTLCSLCVSCSAT